MASWKEVLLRRKGNGAPFWHLQPLARLELPIGTRTFQLLARKEIGYFSLEFFHPKLPSYFIPTVHINTYFIMHTHTHLFNN